MRINIFIDENLLKKVMEIVGVKIKKEVVEIVLKEYLENYIWKNLLELKGKIMFDENYDYKRMRVG